MRKNTLFNSHTMGFCFVDCKYSSAHGPLDKEEAEGLASFLKGAREAKEKDLEKKKAQDNETNTGEKQ